MARWTPPWLRSTGFGAGPAGLKVLAYGTAVQNVREAVRQFMREVGADMYVDILESEKDTRGFPIPPVWDPLPSTGHKMRLYRQLVEAEFFDETRLAGARAAAVAKPGVTCLEFTYANKPFTAEQVRACRKPQPKDLGPAVISPERLRAAVRKE